MRRLLGDDQAWLITLDPRDEAGRARFFQRFVGTRRIGVENGRCVVVR
jgi:hypothetical protein